MAYLKWQYQDDLDDFDDEYDGRSYGYGRRRTPIDVARALEPLVAHLRNYDAHRVELERQGGELQDVKQLADILRQEITISDSYRDFKISLVDQPPLHEMLREVGDYNLYLGVRQLDTRLPVYYLCRLKHQYRSHYDLVLEDLYLSPNYPLPDAPFCQTHAPWP